MGFAILRAKKLKTSVGVKLSLRHAYREQDTPNADPERTPENTHLGAENGAQAIERFNERLPDKVRSNAVLAVEYLITGSPEVMNGKTREQQDAYFADALAWLKERHGAQNIVCAGIHRDETTPHMYAYVVPIDQRGKLNCRAFLGGAAKLSEMQTDFAERVGKRHDLERGIEGSKAKHQRVKSFYGALEKGMAHQVTVSPQAVTPQVLRKGFFSRVEEAPEVIAARLTKGLQTAMAPTVAMASVAEQERRRATELQQTAKSLGERLNAVEGPLKGLSAEQRADVFKLAASHQRENDQTREAKQQRLIEQQREKRDNDRGRGR